MGLGSASRRSSSGGRAVAGEIRDEPNGWTPELLKAYIDRVLAELILRLEQRFQAQQDQLVTVPPVAQQVGQLSIRVDGFSELMEAKFVTYRTLIDSQAEKVALALDAAEKAIDKAEAATEKRFDAVNEFRAQLTDQTASFARRDYVEQEMASVDRRLDDGNAHRLAIIAEFRASMEKLVTKDTLEAFAASSSTDRAGLHDRVKALESRMDVAAGQQQGGTSKVTDQRAFIGSAIAVLGVLITIIVIVANVLSSR
jgi:hypothetical protein